MDVRRAEAGEQVQRRPAAEGLRRKAAKEHASATARVEGQAVTAQRAIAGMAEGRDGRIYALVTQGTPSGDYVLDRYDAVTSQVERVPLQLENLGFVTLAAGRDALYIGGFNPKSGRFKIPWERLEQASWTVLEEARLSSSAAAPEAEQEPPAGG